MKPSLPSIKSIRRRSTRKLVRSARSCWQARYWINSTRTPSKPEPLDRLENLIDTKQLARLQIVQAAAAGRSEEAFRKLIDEWREPVGDDVHVKAYRLRVAHDAWLAGQLLDAWNGMNDEQKTASSDAVEKLIAETDETGMPRLIDAFAFHPATHETIRRHMADLLKANRRVEAEACLRKLVRFGDINAVTQPVRNYAETLADEKQFADARAILVSFRNRVAGRSKDKADEFEELTSQLSTRINELEQSARRDAVNGWPDADWTLRRFPGSIAVSQPATFPVFDPDVQFTADHAMQTRAMSGGNRAFMRRIDDGKTYWSFPIEGSSSCRFVPNGRSVILTQASSKARIRCLSPLEKRELWSRAADYPGYYRTQSPFTVIQSYQYGVSRAARDSVIVTADFVVVLHRRSFDVIDAVTGKLRWVCDSISMNEVGSMHVTDEAVFVGASKRIAFRAIDGKVLSENVAKSAMFGIGVVDGNIVSCQQTGLFAFRQELESRDLISGETQWRYRYPQKTRMALIDRTHVLVVAKTKQLDIIDLATGERKSLKVSKPIPLTARLMIGTDGPRCYVGTNEDGSSFFRSGSAPVNGTLFAFDRATNRELWARPVKNGGVVSGAFYQSPLLFVSEANTTENGNNTVTISAIDRRSGKTVSSSRAIQYYSGLSVTVDRRRRFVELSSHSQRLRFSATVAPQADENGDNSESK